ncbi:hypothetical protein TUE45_04825 [Streptomyces reticuli]|nr:hypothetical protein TUE45_04825 [Streptomyces reticuli]
MRDVIARALMWVLRLVLPARGRHAAPVHTPEPLPEPEPVNPWSRPWRSPSKEEAAELFRRQAEDTLELRAVELIQLRRRIALRLAEGAPEDEYPYTYPGAPFPASAFAVAVTA